MRTEENWQRLYRAMYLKRLKEVIKEHRPSLSKKGTPYFIASQRLSQIFLRCLLIQIQIQTLLCLCKHEKWSVMRSPDKCGDAADVFRLGSERRRDWCLSFRQRDAHVCSSQGSAVICSVPTHAHSVAAAKQRFTILYWWFKLITSS